MFEMLQHIFDYDKKRGKEKVGKINTSTSNRSVISGVYTIV